MWGYMWIFKRASWRRWGVGEYINSPQSAGVFLKIHYLHSAMCLWEHTIPHTSPRRGGGLPFTLLPRFAGEDKGGGRKSGFDREKHVGVLLPSPQSPPTSWEGSCDWTSRITGGGCRGTSRRVGERL